MLGRWNHCESHSTQDGKETRIPSPKPRASGFNHYTPPRSQRFSGISPELLRLRSIFYEFLDAFSRHSVSILSPFSQASRPYSLFAAGSPSLVAESYHLGRSSPACLSDCGFWSFLKLWIRVSCISLEIVLPRNLFDIPNPITSYWQNLSASSHDSSQAYHHSADPRRPHKVLCSHGSTSGSSIHRTYFSSSFSAVAYSWKRTLFSEPYKAILDRLGDEERGEP